MSYIIYTTGIYNWGNLDIIEFWNTHLRDHVIGLLGIPEKIVHYDPMMSDTGQSLAKPENIRLVKSILRKEPFIPEPLPVEALVFDQRPHLIIDCAHIFQYNEQGIPVYNGMLYKTLNVIYPGYLGTEPDNKKNRDLAMSRHFIDYIKLIVRCFGKLTVNYEGICWYPFEDVAEAVKEAKKKIVVEWRKRYGRAGDEYDVFISENLTVNKVLEILSKSNSKPDFIDRVTAHAASLF